MQVLVGPRATASPRHTPADLPQPRGRPGAGCVPWPGWPRHDCLGARSPSDRRRASTDATAGHRPSLPRRRSAPGGSTLWPWYGVLVDNDDERSIPGPGRSYSRGRRRVGILVVTYNAESTLAATLDRIPIDFRAKIDEILVFDDASADKTVDVAVRWRDANGEPPTTVVRHLKNLGYGGNQKAGYKFAIERGLDIIVLLHGDGQYAPECLQSMVAPLERGEADAVFGSRMLERGASRRGGMPAYKWLGNRILTRIENSMLGSNLSEFHSGYRAYNVAALAELPFENNSDGFDFDTQIIVQLL